MITRNGILIGHTDRVERNPVWRAWWFWPVCERVSEGVCGPVLWACVLARVLSRLWSRLLSRLWAHCLGGLDGADVSRLGCRWCTLAVGMALAPYPVKQDEHDTEWVMRRYGSLALEQLTIALLVVIAVIGLCAALQAGPFVNSALFLCASLAAGAAVQHWPVAFPAGSRRVATDADFDG